MSLIAALLLAQVTPVQPILKGTGLPPPGSDEGAIMAPIDTLLNALTAKDEAAVLAVTLPEGSATQAAVAADGTRTRNTTRWADFAANLKTAPGRLVERLGQPAIEFDEDTAMVWAPYTFTIDGKLTHCGYDHFDLVRVDGRWKVLNLTWSKRTTGCGAE